MFVIVAFPVMGCVIYYFVEVFPGSRESAARARRRATWCALQPDAELKNKAEELAVCGRLNGAYANDGAKRASGRRRATRSAGC